MSADKPRRMVKIWDDLEAEEQVPDAKTAAFLEAWEADLDAFDQHKDALLECLRSAYERGPKSQPFNERRSWRRLTILAGQYPWEARVREEIMPSAKLRARLREIGKALTTARTLANEATQDDVGAALCSAWWEGTSEFAEAEGRFVDFLYIDRQFERVVASLAALETAASRAADDVPRGKGGRPANLAPGYIRVLANIYQEFTERKPGAGRGPFTRFVMQFRAALDPSYKTTDENGEERVDESIVDAIKHALGKRHERPKRSTQPKRRLLIPYAGSR